MENYSKLVCQECGNTNLEEYSYGTPPISYNQCDPNFQNTWQSPYSQNYTDTSPNSVIIPDLKSPMGVAQPLTFEAPTQNITQHSLTENHDTQEVNTSDFFHQNNMMKVDIKHNCPWCCKTFDSLHDLKEHKHLEHQHQCEQCQKSFSDTVSYNRHIRNAHIHKLSKVKYPSLRYRINRSLTLHYSDNPEQ